MKRFIYGLVVIASFLLGRLLPPPRPVTIEKFAARYNLDIAYVGLDNTELDLRCHDKPDLIGPVSIITQEKSDLTKAAMAAFLAQSVRCEAKEGSDTP